MRSSSSLDVSYTNVTAKLDQQCYQFGMPNKGCLVKRSPSIDILRIEIDTKVYKGLVGGTIEINEQVLIRRVSQERGDNVIMEHIPPQQCCNVGVKTILDEGCHVIRMCVVQDGPSCMVLMRKIYPAQPQELVHLRVKLLACMAEKRRHPLIVNRVGVGTPIQQHADIFCP